MMARFVQAIPEPVTSWLKGTPIDKIYQLYRVKNLETVSTVFDTPAGDLRLKVPRDHPFLEKSNKPGGHEPALTKELEMIIDEETVFYDIGARFGYHTVLSMMLGVPENQIHAFEGHPVPFSVLEENHKDSAFLTNSYVGDGSKNLSLDDYISRNQDPTVLKIDVEGAEVDVLRGATDLLSKSRPEIYIEIHPHQIHRSNGDVDDIYDLLRSIGYQLSILNHRATDSVWQDFDRSDSIRKEVHLLRGRC
ncbi:FkbM family methyltransferase [Halospeciosus flavus]|uniref:FkbM family methyltransferase n=1 Tax=Halospeciosus flavus TaxID=3032283 RepID=A0ABD5Z640_9EURY|nr:FkbM family methyltransferase [Halospeciosus flavus]